MGKSKELQRIDKKLKDVFNIYKNEGRVETFPEFSRIAADKLMEDMVQTKKKRKRFIL